MTDDEIIAVVQAHKEGKQIQVNFNDVRAECEHFLWWDASPKYIDWNFANFRYRVAPEPRKPREWWIDVRWVRIFEYPYDETIHVREVLE